MLVDRRVGFSIEEAKLTIGRVELAIDHRELARASVESWTDSLGR